MSKASAATIKRLVPYKPLPPYAYLPGRFPHPTRNPLGHSFGMVLIDRSDVASLSGEAFCWGIDLFNLGYYWEAHEAWEDVWRRFPTSSWERNLLKGLILLCAAGVKVREGKAVARERHARKAAGLFCRVRDAKVDIRPWLGMSTDVLLSAVSAIPSSIGLEPRAFAQRQVFSFTFSQHSGMSSMSSDGAGTIELYDERQGLCDWVAHRIMSGSLQLAQLGSLVDGLMRRNPTVAVADLAQAVRDIAPSSALTDTAIDLIQRHAEAR